MDDMTARSETVGADRFERAIAAWGRDARLGDSLGGGSRNDVREVWVGSVRHVARWSPRSAPALAWETDLLLDLARAGLHVPRPVSTPDGRTQVDGVTVVTWLDGDPPESRADWRAVGTTLAHLHTLTRERGQRPGFVAVTDLRTTTLGGDIDLDGMPADAVATCRAAWAALPPDPPAVVHGDPGAANVRLWRGQAGLIDWDEARVDLPLFDLVSLPLPRVDIARLTGQPLSGPGLAAARRAALAWEVANGWTVEPAYARRCLDRLLTDETMSPEAPGSPSAPASRPSSDPQPEDG